MLDVVVEGGFGNASQRFYLPALKTALEKGLHRIILTDVRECPPELSELTAPNILTLHKNDPAGKRLYEQLSPHIIRSIFRCVRRAEGEMVAPGDA